MFGFGWQPVEEEDNSQLRNWRKPHETTSRYFPKHYVNSQLIKKECIENYCRPEERSNVKKEIRSFAF